MKKKQRSQNSDLIQDRKQNRSLKVQVPDSSQLIKIIAIRDDFIKNIQDPIKSIQDIAASNSPQRCLFHNNILSLYCEIDRKPLCANCMYQQQTHRKHRVVPISKVMNIIKQDITSFTTKIQSNITQCQFLSNKLQQTIIKNQNYYPSIKSKLKEYYQSLINMLKDKQQQHINYINQLKQQMNSQFTFLDKQIKKIKTLLISKSNFQQKEQNDENFIFRRNILQILIRSNRIINNDIIQVFPQQDPNKNIINFNLFNDISSLITSKLIIASPPLSQKPKNKLVRPLRNNKNYSPNIRVHSQKKLTKRAFTTPYNDVPYRKNKQKNNAFQHEL